MMLIARHLLSLKCTVALSNLINDHLSTDEKVLLEYAIINLENVQSVLIAFNQEQIDDQASCR